MSDKIDQFCESLRVKLNSVESYLAQVGENSKAAPQQASAALQSSIESVKTQHAKNMQNVADAKAKLEQRVKTKTEEVEASIEQWKKDREISKLDNRAVLAEEYAIAAIEIAASSVAEADLATLEAIAARMDAEEAKSSNV